MVVFGFLCDTFIIGLQFDARVSANLTLAHESCPAGFEEVEGISLKQYNCRCSKTDSNVQSCNETTEDVLLKVRESACHASTKCIHDKLLDVHHSATIFTSTVSSIFLLNPI